MVAWLGRRRALRVSAALHGAAFACMLAAGATIWKLGAQPKPIWAGPVLGISLGLAGFLLALEQRWAEDVNLAFFKVNVVVGFAVLLMVLVTRAAGGF